VGTAVFVAECGIDVDVGTDGGVVEVAVGELYGVTVNKGHRVLVAVACGVRVSRLVAVAVGMAVGDALRVGTAPGADIVTITGSGTGVSEGLGVTKAI
jgi:hypothetical protein